MESTTPAVPMPELAALERALSQRGADRVEHLAGTLLSHLRRTARRLDSWGAEHALVAAGLAHAAYGTQCFPTALFRLDERAQLRSLLGEEAEAIVYAYCALDRTSYARDGSSELRDRFRGERFIPSARMRAELAELTAANELDVLETLPLSAADIAGLAERMVAGERSLSEAARAAFHASACFSVLEPICTGPRSGAEPATHLAGPQSDPEIAYLDLGTRGERILFWHGGASPELTWVRQHGLSADHRLRIPWRRGLAPSVAAVVHDWERDARDLLRIMPGAVHVVAHSWGGVSALVAAARAPQRFRSLTVIEPPMWSSAHEQPAVQELVALSRAFMAGAPAARHAFLALAGMPLDHPDTARIERHAHRVRDPAEARPDFTALRESKRPIAIVSGEHTQGIELVCDALAATLGAERWRLAGAGHAVQRHPAFNDRLRELIARVA